MRVALGNKLLLWAIDNRQYDDLDKEAWRIIADDKSQKNGDGAEGEKPVD